MKSEQKQPINISIWGKFPEWEETTPADFLWHDTVEALPELGSVLLILGTTFQVEAVCLDGNDVEQQTYLIDVRSYAGSIAPTFVFSCLRNLKSLPRRFNEKSTKHSKKMTIRNLVRSYRSVSCIWMSDNSPPISNTNEQ